MKRVALTILTATLLATTLAVAETYGTPYVQVEDALWGQFGNFHVWGANAPMKVYDHFVSGERGIAKGGALFLQTDLPAYYKRYRFGLWMVADPRHRLVAFSRLSMSISNTLMVYAQAGRLNVPHRDLSGIHTVYGLRIGSAEAHVVAALGKPRIWHSRSGHDILLAYQYRYQCEADSLSFVIRNGRVAAIGDAGYSC